MCIIQRLWRPCHMIPKAIREVRSHYRQLRLERVVLFSLRECRLRIVKPDGSRMSYYNKRDLIFPALVLQCPYNIAHLLIRQIHSDLGGEIDECVLYLTFPLKHSHSYFPIPRSWLHSSRSPTTSQSPSQHLLSFTTHCPCSLRQLQIVQHQLIHLSTSRKLCLFVGNLKHLILPLMKHAFILAPPTVNHKSLSRSAQPVSIHFSSIR